MIQITHVFSRDHHMMMLNS